MAVIIVGHTAGMATLKKHWDLPTNVTLFSLLIGVISTFDFCGTKM